MPNAVQILAEGNEFRFCLELADPAAMPMDIAALNAEMDVFLELRQVEGDNANALRIAIEELLTNLVKFGSAAEVSPDAVLHAEGVVAIGDADVRLTLSDDGRPFDPSRYPPPELDPETFLNRPPGGLGLHILHQLFEDVQYRRENQCNVAVWRRRRDAPTDLPPETLG